MLRSILSRGSSLTISSTSSTFRPSTLTSTSSLITRHYAANPHPTSNPHPTTNPQAGSSPAEQHHQHDKATHHGGHDSHAVDSHGNEHHSEHHGDHHDDHHHINHDNGPYGILFGEVYEGKRKIPAWEWIYYAGALGTILATLYVYRDFDERKIETWARRTYEEAVEHSRRTDAEGIAKAEKARH
eukprot:Phypoly_transcript_17473.p1 GENE.Phypoly_transcript_17473~~Phypoly_transcript_17473.p1  ORF type:complete len:185 (+),score=39.98 Phypoly_transcript_17473:239-793(+)